MPPSPPEATRPRRRPGRTATRLRPQILVAPAVAVALGSAATGATAQALRIVPSLSASETLTSNVQPGTANSQSDSITQVSGGLSLSGRSGRFNGSVNYALTGIVYARHSESNQHQQSLNAQVHSELIENQAFVDASASISRQSISAFGTQTYDPALINANSTEVRSLQVSPSFRGRLPGLWSYVAAASYGITRSGAGGVADSSTSSTSLQLDRAQQGRLGWSVLAKRSTVKYAATGDTTDTVATLTASLAVPEADLQLSGTGGWERTNVTTASQEGGATWGAALGWTPSPRTRLDASYDKHPFGPSHSVSVETRSARTVWTFSSSQQISTPRPSTGTTFYDLYYTLFSSLEPDPAKRSQLVNTFLLQNGINPNGAVPGGFIPLATTWSNSQSFSAGLVGVRSSITLTAGLSDSWQSNAATQVGGDLANGQHVRAKTLSLNVSHRLTPVSTLNLVGAVSNSYGGQSSQSSTLRTLSLAWSGNPTPHLTMSALVRRSDFTGSTSPYHENALVGTVAVRF